MTLDNLIELSRQCDHSFNIILNGVSFILALGRLNADCTIGINLLNPDSISSSFKLVNFSQMIPQYPVFIVQPKAQDSSRYLYLYLYYQDNYNLPCNTNTCDKIRLV